MLTKVEFSSSVVESFVDSREDYLAAMAMEGRFTSNPDSLVWLAADEGDALFSHRTLTDIAASAEAIRQLPYVQRVTCLTDADVPGNSRLGNSRPAVRLVLNSQLRQGKIPEDAKTRAATDRSIARLLKRRKAAGGELSAEQSALLAQRLGEDELIAGRLLSHSGTAHVILIELIAADQLSPAKQIEITDQLQSIARDHNLGKQAIHISGLVPMQAFAFDQINLIVQTLLPLGVILISAAVMLVFRRFEVILFTLVLAAIANCWGIALGIACYGKFSVLMAAVPLMVLVISTADVIHLLSSYTAEREKGHKHQDALRKMFTEVGGACVLTSLTTFVGFASLVMVPSNTIRQFGFSAAAGVAGALLLSVVLIPLLLHWLHWRGRPITASASASRLTTNIAFLCLGVALRWPRSIALLFAGLLIACGIGSYGLTLDPDIARRFPEGHPVTQSSQFFNDEFGGVNAIEVVLEAPPETLLRPATFQSIRQFSESCQQQISQSKITSIDNALSPLLSQLDYKNTLGVAESPQHARAAIDLLAASNQSAVKGLITSDKSAIRILIQVQQTSYIQLLEISEQVESLADEHFDSSVDVSLKGSAPLVGKAVREIIRGHMHGFGFCFTTIVILIIIGLRSAKLGWLSILPNLTPLLMLGGLIALRYTRVDSDILAVATLGLGLSVDDTIHFMSRFQIERRSGKSVTDALRNTMSHTGVAIIRTTVILSVGFIPFAFSNYWSINMLGTYLVAVLFSAVAADLLFLPALMRLAYGRDPDA